MSNSNDHGTVPSKFKQMKAHQEALTASLKLKDIHWSSVLLYEFSPAGLEKLQRRLNVIEHNYYLLREYVDGYQSAGNLERRKFALAMIRQYSQYIGVINQAMDDLVGMLQAAANQGRQESLFDSYDFEAGKIDD